MNEGNSIQQRADTQEPIKLYWWWPDNQGNIPSDGMCIPNVNFGDALSRIVVEKLSGRKVVFASEPPKLLAVGSVFFQARAGDTVWGSGLLSQAIPPQLPKDIHITAVRGPLTREALLKHQIFCPAIFGDPALLLPRLLNLKPNPQRDWGLIPHIETADQYGAYQEHIIDVRWPPMRVIEEILKCKLVISASLHGIIVAEAYGIPAIWLDSPNHHFKYKDYYLSTNRHMRPEATVEAALAAAPPAPFKPLDTAPLLKAFPYHTKS